MTLKFSFIVYFLVGLPIFNSIGQINISLKSKLLSADSIVLISYSHIQGKGDRKAILNDQMNLINLKEYISVKKSGTIELASILTTPFKDNRIEEMGCFDPHHTIYIFKKRIISYITVCFECEEIVVSDDLDIPENDFDKATWKKLKSFFRKQGIKYGY